MSAGSRGKNQADREAGRATPGAHLRAEFRRLGLDQVAVSKATGVSRQSVNNIVNGRQPISRAMAGRLGRLTGHSSDYWLGESFGGSEPVPYSGGGGLLVNHQIAQAVKDGVLDISPFNAKNLRAASIELTLHAGIQTPEGKHLQTTKTPGRAFELAAGQAVQARTSESIELPRDYLGRIAAVNGLYERGVLALSPLQIEPGFKGRLPIRLFNAGSAAFLLRTGMPIVALEFYRLSAVPSA